MKILKIFIAIIVASFTISNISYSQFSLSLGPIVGLTSPTGDYSGNTMDYYAGTNYGLKSGVNFGLLFKATAGPLNIRASGVYSILSNSGNSEPGQGSIDVKQNLFMLTVGPEFGITIPFSPIRPYFGLDLLLTSISGESTFQGVSRVPSGTYDMQTASRWGIGAGAGLEVALGKDYSLDFGLRYNFINLIGKEFVDIGSSDKRVDSYLSLNDEKDPVNPNDINEHPIGSSRSISTFQINVAFLFAL